MTLLRTLCLSLILHTILFLYLREFPQPRLDNLKTVEIEILNQDRDEPKTLVRETTPLNSTDKPKDKIKHLSETTKSVQEEMRAVHTGLTKNRAESKPKIKETPNRLSQKFLPKPGLEFPSKKPVPEQKQNPDPSTVGEKLSDKIKLGQWTALNTERYLYYSFFSRVEEKVRYRWESRIRDTASTIHPRVLVHKEWVTQVEILLNPDGRFQRALIRGKCGIEGFDLAPIEAFRDGSPYLNPPKEMIQDDGLIHLHYALSVRWGAQGL